MPRESPFSQEGHEKRPLPQGKSPRQRSCFFIQRRAALCGRDCRPLSQGNIPVSYSPSLFPIIPSFPFAFNPFFKFPTKFPAPSARASSPAGKHWLIPLLLLLPAVLPKEPVILFARSPVVNLEPNRHGNKDKEKHPDKQCPGTQLPRGEPLHLPGRKG